MKHRIFKYLRNFAAAGMAAFALLLASCSNVDADDTVIPVQAGQKVAVRIALAETARSLFPEISRDDFVSLVLKCDGKVAEAWADDVETGMTAYQMMSMSVITLDAGEHTFTLTGTVKGGATYADTITQTVANGSVLSFTLSASSFAGTGSATFNFWLKLPSDKSVKTVRLAFYATEDGVTYDTTKAVKENVWSYNDGCTSLNSSVSYIPAGLYVAVFSFYGDTARNAEIGSWEEVVGIVSGKTISFDKTLSVLNKVYTITYHLNGGTGSSSQSYSSLSPVTLTTPKKSNLDFGGWYTAEDCSGTATTDWEPHTRIGDIDLYAKWNYTVTFKANAPADGEVTGEMENAVGHEGYALALPKNAFACEGYLFDGWNTVAKPTSSKPGEKVEDCGAFVGRAHTTLYAQWKKRTADTVAVTFRANGGTLVDIQQVASGSTLTEPTTTRTGYKLLGWFEKEDLTGDAVDFTAYKPTADATLYASWKAEKYKITYYDYDSSNDEAAFTGEHETGYAQEHVYGTATKLDSPTKDDFLFTGWHLKKGTSLENAIDTLSADGYTEAITLYATWMRVNYYVSASGSNDNTGAKDAPFATVKYAISKIKALGSNLYDYTIVIEGELTERVSVDSYSLNTAAAKTLTIRGKTGNETDIINANESGVTLVISMSVPVIVKNLTITGGINTSSQNYAGGVVLNSTGASLTLGEGTLVTGNENKYNNSYGAGGVYVNNGTLTIEDGAKITNNTAYYGGGIGLYASSDAIVIMNGGEINGNTSYYHGAGVYVGQSSYFTMNGGKITGNKIQYSSSMGGGIYSYRYAIVTINGGEITNNTSGGSGGGIYMDYHGSLTINDGKISGNVAATTGYGGGVYSCSHFTMNGGEISGNTAGYGGGVYHYNYPFYMLGGTISGNTATKQAGAMYSNSQLFMGGDAYIPAGEDGKNDVLCSFAVGIESDLTAPSPVATITRSSYSDGSELLYATDKALLAGSVDKLAFNHDDTPWTKRIEGNYCKLCRPEYAITYLEQGGGELEEELAVTAPMYHKYGSETVLPVPVKAGYTFMGWYFEKDCSGVQVKKLSKTGYTDAITLYAKWTKESVAVEVNASDISITKTVDKENGTITLTPLAGFKDYAWVIGGEAATDVIEGSTVSATDNSLTFATEKLMKGRTYVVMLTAKNANNKLFTTTISIKK